MRYKVYGSEMEHTFEEKDLGVTIDMKLTLEDHIASKLRTANAMMEGSKNAKRESGKGTGNKVTGG